MKRFIIEKPWWVTVLLLLLVNGILFGGWIPDAAALTWVVSSIAVLIWRNGERQRTLAGRPTAQQLIPPVGTGVRYAAPPWVAGNVPVTTQAERDPRATPGVGVVGLAVVGLGYHNGMRYLRPGAHPAELRREPHNSHDLNAVAVWVGMPPRMTGYIRADDAITVATHMDIGRVSRVAVEARTDGAGRCAVLVPQAYAPGLDAGDDQADDDFPMLWPTSLTAWGRLSEVIEVEGEALRRSNITAVFAACGVTIAGDDGYERGSELVEIPGVLALPDPDLSIDTSTILVVIEDQTVGTLPISEARRYRAAVKKADAQHAHVPVRARVWAVDDLGTIRSRVTIKAPPPDLIWPPMPLPAGDHAVLPHGSKVQVTGEEAFLDTLTSILGRRAEVQVVATLHEQALVGRSTRCRVAVQIGGQSVGVLSPTMSDHFLPIVRSGEAAKKVVACRAVVAGNAAKADVVLDAARSADLDPDWIGTHLAPTGEIVRHSDHDLPPTWSN
ncbi:HIRAN domain-containing protein [Micropruina sp.]|uniref:HIRAN domain-containing protein n=1 Tax=Micropruina sp. TaxID=2737536 RepID=UPI0039E65F95